MVLVLLVLPGGGIPQSIAAETRMATAELKRTLQTFACAKYKILTKHPKGREVDDADAFSFNAAFTCPMAKLKIQTVAVRVETNDERKETEDKVDEARNTQCDVSPSLEGPGGVETPNEGVGC